MSKTTWSFQIIPATPDIIGNRFSSDFVIKKVESEIDTELPANLKFHKVNKIVIELGGGIDKKDYNELLGVGIKRYKNFNLNTYKEYDDVKKEQVIKQVVRDVINWIIDDFDDSEVFTNLKKKIIWLEK